MRPIQTREFCRLRSIPFAKIIQCTGARASLHYLSTAEQDIRRTKRSMASLNCDEKIRSINNRRCFHVSSRNESTLIIAGAGAVAAAVVIGKIMDRSSKKAADKASEDSNANTKASTGQSESTAGTSNTRDTVFTEAKAEASQQRNTGTGASSTKDSKKSDSDAKDKESAGPSYMDEVMGEIFALWGGNWMQSKQTFFAKNFYEGGFEEKMTRREAALILGVRENTAEARIKESHRRILLLNHPDRGGSPYIAAKINLAKDLLIKGK